MEKSILTLLNSQSAGTSPTAVTLDATGVIAIVAEANFLYFPISLNGTIGGVLTYATNAAGVAASSTQQASTYFWWALVPAFPTCGLLSGG
jgi:hypothetical protein